MEKSQLKRNGVTWLLLGMLGIYLAAIAWINFSAVPGFYDADMYADVLYAVKAWEAKTLFPENWIFGNQLNVVAAPALAAVIYGMGATPFQAMAWAATIMSVLLLLAMDWMLKPVLRQRNSRLVCALTFLSVMLFYNEAVHGLKGWQLFFTMCAYYTGYCINLFLAIGCYLRANGPRGRGFGAILALTCLLSFGTGMQSIRQTLVMAVPLAALECLRFLGAKCSHRTLKKAPLAVAMAISVSNVAGVIAASGLTIQQVDNLGAIKLNALSQMPAAAVNAVITIYSMFVNYDVISFILLGILALCYASGSYVCVRQAVKQKNWELAVPILALAIAVCAIGAVAVFTTMDVAARYYFPMYPLVGLLVAHLYEAGNKAVRASVLGLLVLIFGLSCGRELAPTFQEAITDDTDYAYEIADYLVENEYTHACSLWHSGIKVLVASEGQVEGVFRREEHRPFLTVGFLYDANVTAVAPEHCAYLFDGKDDAEKAVALAKEKGVEMELVTYFAEYDYYLYEAPVNMMAIFS